MKVKDESEKAGLKLKIQNTTVRPSGPITSWKIEGEKVETVTGFIFLVSKITADGDFSHEITICAAKVSTTMKLKDTCSLEGKL